jgi:hypothetical protein
VTIPILGDFPPIMIPNLSSFIGVHYNYLIYDLWGKYSQIEIIDKNRHS